MLFPSNQKTNLWERVGHYTPTSHHHHPPTPSLGTVVRRRLPRRRCFPGLLDHAIEFSVSHHIFSLRFPLRLRPVVVTCHHCRRHGHYVLDVAGPLGLARGLMLQVRTGTMKRLGAVRSTLMHMQADQD